MAMILLLEQAGASGDEDPRHAERGHSKTNVTSIITS